MVKAVTVLTTKRIQAFLHVIFIYKKSLKHLTDSARCYNYKTNKK